MPSRTALGTSRQTLVLNQKLALTSTNNHRTPQNARHDALYKNERLDEAGDGGFFKAFRLKRHTSAVF